MCGFPSQVQSCSKLLPVTDHHWCVLSIINIYGIGIYSVAESALHAMMAHLQLSTGEAMIASDTSACACHLLRHSVRNALDPDMQLGNCGGLQKAQQRLLKGRVIATTADV